MEILSHIKSNLIPYTMSEIIKKGNVCINVKSRGITVELTNNIIRFSISKLSIKIYDQCCSHNWGIYKENTCIYVFDKRRIESEHMNVFKRRNLIVIEPDKIIWE